FLGHPIYSMTVVLFSLLVATGMGSFFSSNLWNRRNSLLVSLCFVLTLNGLVQPYILEHFASASTALRILVAILLLFPMGTLMGMGFPIGMQWVSRSKLDIGPWLFGINGSMSIVGSVAAMGLSLFFNIDTTFFMGTLCYLIASGTLLLKSGSPSPNFSMLGSPNENSCAL
ncbi:MAG: hypothetical protein ACKOA8_10345, partial [Deltaproteobacteria bacterium]